MKGFGIVAEDFLQKAQTGLGIQFFEFFKLGVQFIETAELALAVGKVQTDAAAFGCFADFGYVHHTGKHFAQRITGRIARQARLIQHPDQRPHLFHGRLAFYF